MTCKEPSSSGRLRVWELVLRAPFGEQWSLIQVGVRVGQRVKLKLGMKAARREELGGGGGSWHPGALLECKRNPFRTGHCGISTACLSYQAALSCLDFCLLLLRNLISHLDIFQKALEASGDTHMNRWICSTDSAPCSPAFARGCLQPGQVWAALSE